MTIALAKPTTLSFAAPPSKTSEKKSNEANESDASKDVEADNNFSRILARQNNQNKQTDATPSPSRSEKIQGNQATNDSKDSLVPIDPSQLFANLGLPVPPTPASTLPKTSVTETTTDNSSGITLTLGEPANEEKFLEKPLEKAVADLSDIPLRDQALQKTAATDGGAFAAKLAAALPEATVQTTQGSDGTLTSTLSVANNATTTQASATSELRINTPVRAPSWATDFAQKVVWMSRQGLQSAHVTINPENLGPIEISLDIRNDQASAMFVSANADVREAIDSALPRLREMLANVGVDLGQTNVSHESFQQANEQRNAHGNARNSNNLGKASVSDTDTAIVTITTGRVQSGNSLVDIFA